MQLKKMSKCEFLRLYIYLKSVSDINCVDKRNKDIKVRLQCMELSPLLILYSGVRYNKEVVI